MSEIGIKDQCFGVEVEMTGITRRQAAEALAAYFGTSVHYCGTYYDAWGVTDPEGKEWKLMSDSSTCTLAASWASLLTRPALVLLFGKPRSTLSPGAASA